MTNPTPHGQVPEALRLADLLLNLQTHMGPRRPSHPDDAHCWDGYTQSSAELRRLHAENEALRAQQVDAYDLGPQAETVEEAARDVGKWLNERPNRPLDLRHVAMLTHHAKRTPQSSPTAQAAESVPAVSDLPPLPDPDLRDVGTKPQDVKDFLNGYATEYARIALAARARLLDSDLSNLTERGAKAWAGVDARGLRDGVASVAASAPAPSGHIKEPYTVAEIKAKIASNDYSAELLLQHAMLHLDRLAASAGSEPVAGAVLDDEGSVCLIRRGTEREYIARRGGSLLYTQPSPPGGMVGGWSKGVEAAAALLSKKADDYARENGYDDMGSLSFGSGSHADAKLDYHSSLIELAEEVRAMLNAPPTNPAGSGKGSDG